MKSQRASSPKGGRPADPRRRVLILDDHPIMRLGLTQLIDGETDLVVCAEASDARQALSAIPLASPHLVVGDVGLPGLSIIEFMKAVRVRWPELPVLVLSNYDESLFAERMIQAGARGYVMKREGGGTLLAAIRQVLGGRPYLSETMTEIAFAALGRRNGNGSEASGVPQLSDREFEVLRCFGAGKTTREAAEELGISAKTVETHRLSLCRKLGLKSAAALIRFALQFDECGVQGTPADAMSNLTPPAPRQLPLFTSDLE